MAKFAPHYNSHRLTSIVRSLNSWIFWAVFIISSLPILFYEISSSELCRNWLNIINIIFILLFFTLDTIVEFILFPQSEQKRRYDFLDNSFGSKFSVSSSVDYYSNDNVGKGLYKAACNLFENSYFTYSLIKTLTIRKIILPALVLFSVFVMAYFGFRKVPFALSVLQVMFSLNVSGNLIKHLILLSKVSAIHDSWVELFQIHDFKDQPLLYQTIIYRNWLNYESLLSRIQPEIPDMVFKTLNTILSKEWELMQTKYSINY